MLSRIFATPWTIACQASLSVEFSRQEYWSGLPFSTPGDIPNPESLLCLLYWQVDSLPLCHLGNPIIYACSLSKRKVLMLSKRQQTTRTWTHSVMLPVKLSCSTCALSNHSDPRPSMGKVPPGSWGHCSIFDEHSCSFKCGRHYHFFFFLNLKGTLFMSRLWKLVMDREAWRATVHGVVKSRMWLSMWTELKGIMFRRKTIFRRKKL